MNRLRIRLVRSPIGSKPKLRRTVTALGLRRMNSAVEHEATPAILGMVRSVAHLIAVEDAEATVRSERAKVSSGRRPEAKAESMPAGGKPTAQKSDAATEAGGAKAKGASSTVAKPEAGTSAPGEAATAGKAAPKKAAPKTAAPKKPVPKTAAPKKDAPRKAEE